MTTPIALTLPLSRENAAKLRAFAAIDVHGTDLYRSIEREARGGETR